MADLSPRRQRILFALCRDYIVTGRPVASASLTQHLEWSSATIRNELAALEEQGLLHQPHQSAGRVPSAAGIRLYVGSLGALPPLRPEVRRAVDVSFGEVVHGPEGMRAAVRVISELVGCVAVTFVGEGRRGVMRQVDLVPVQGARALVVVGLDDGATHVHPVTLQHGLPSDASGSLASSCGRLQERLRGLCIGKTLTEARADLTRMWAEQEAHLDRLLVESLRLGLWMCTAAALDPLWVQIAGQKLLAGQSDQTLAQILALFDDYHGLAELLCQLLPERVGLARAEVHVAAELRPGVLGLGGLTRGLGGARERDAMEPPYVLAGLSLVGCRVQPGDDDSGRTAGVALLGPDRMDYEAVIPLVEYAAQALAARTSE